MSAETIIILSEVFFLFLCASFYVQLWEKKEKQYVVKRIESLLPVLSAPAVWQCLLIGNGWYKAVGFFLCILLLTVWFVFFRQRKFETEIIELKKMLVLYTLGMLSVSGITIYETVLEKEKSVSRTILILSVFVLICTLQQGILTIRKWRKNQAEIKEPVGEIGEEKKIVRADQELEKQVMGGQDFLMLLGIMFLYGAVTFVGLGSREMPQTYMEIVPEEEGTREIILDMGEEKEIATLSMHLGHILDRTISVFYYDENLKKWIPIKEEVQLKANYNWNEVEIDQKFRYLGIVSGNGKAVFHEIVLLDDQGEMVLPVNEEEYPLLFDEQELFPEEMTYYYRTMFDEIYYAGSAYEFLNGMKMFEETHPPMGKILIALGICLFGVNPFGWRFSCALFGLLMLPLLYWFLYRMFKSSRVAMVGTALLGLDFMHYSLSRIATLDSIIAFFILAMFAVMWRILELVREESKASKKRPSLKVVVLMLVCAFFTGMGVATKWTGFYAMAGIAILFVGFIIFQGWEMRKAGIRFVYGRWLLGSGILIFGSIPLLIYVLSFLPQSIAVGEANVWKVMWESSRFMLKFHSDIVFEHPYSSPWYTWAWMKMPLMDAVNNLKDGKWSIILTMGNPIIWWFGLASFFHMLYRAVFRRDYKAGYLAFAYLAMYAPWFFVKRTVFIYQYYGSSLFMICMLGYSLCLLGKKRKKLVPLFLEAALFAFILFFPVISGYPVTGYYFGIYLEWLRSWNFVQF